MDPRHARPAEYGSLRLIVGRRYRVIREFTGHGASVHLPGEEFTYLGASYFPYDEGHTIYVTIAEGAEGLIALCGLDPEPNRVLDAMQVYIEPM